MIASTTISTQRPFGALFQCNFDSACFADNQLKRTDGSEFILVESSDGLEPPRAPTSDVTSITVSTNNNETCKLPYQLPFNNGTDIANWNMYFCYNDQCPTQSGQTGTCDSGFYGLTSLNSSEPSKTIIGSIDSNSILRDSVGQQCLRFYYYFTIYDKEDWGQRIQVLIRPNNETADEFSIKNLTIVNMNENKWEFQSVTFNSTFSRYTLVFSFSVDEINQTVEVMSNQTIYFALDNIELYDFNCSYVNEQLTTSTTMPMQKTTTISTSTTSETFGGQITSGTPTGSNTGLIVGLTLGLGIPALIGIAVGGYFWKKRRDNHQTESFDLPMVKKSSRIATKTLTR
ncbi:unnamed protein product [Rotaria sp. Silwood2]|nr:unnamed protein product [Rotaria sp. Silwood2]CAF4025844.1 unnamed protein product [Rotaria sp. Silwood2]